jgi:hypothetical protein
MRTPPKSLLSLLILLFGLFAAIPMAGAQSAQGAANAAKKGAGFEIPVTGGGPGSTFDGTFTIDRFVATADNNTAAAHGVLKGTVTNTATGAKSSVVKNVAWPVSKGSAARPTKFVPTDAPTNFVRTADGNTAAADGMLKVQASCDILNLVLGPLHLDLLGLVVDLNQVILNITGETGAGNLLGNLLCGITGILDGVGIGAQLAQLLNQLLGILG